MDLHKHSPPSPVPSAPPQPPPEFKYLATTTVLPKHKTNAQNVPATLDPDSYSPVAWSSGLCDCFNDVNSCCLTCWCPCIAFGRIAEIVDRGTTSCGVSGTLYALIMCVTGCSCLYSCFYRSKMRGMYLLEERPCTDCCIHCWCEECSLCQEYRQLQHYGFDMSIGWHGNMERMKRLAVVPPTVTGGMVR